MNVETTQATVAHQSHTGGSGAAPTPGNPILQLHRRLRGKYRYAIPAGLILGICAAAGAYRLIPEKYESIGVVQIAPTSQRVLYATEQNEAVPMFDAWVESQMGQIQGPRVISLAMKNQVWRENADSESRTEFLEDLVVTRVKNSLLIHITYTSQDPAASQAAVQSVIEAYHEVHLDQTSQGQVWTVDTLQGLISELDLQRQDKRNRIAEISGPLSPSAMVDLYGAKFQEQIELESMLMTARMELAAIIALNPEPDEEGGDLDGEDGGDLVGDESDEVLTAHELSRFDDSLARLLATHEAHGLRMAEVVDRFGANHPEVAGLRRSMGVLENRIAERVEELNILIAKTREDQEAGTGLGVNNDLLRRPTAEILEARINSLMELRDEVKQQAESLNFDITQIEEIKEEDVILARQQSDATTRLAALQIENDNTGRVSIINEGELPSEPANYRKRLQMTGAAGVVGLGFPFGIAFLIGLLRGRLDHFEDAKANWGGGAFLGILPELPSNMADPQQALVASLSVHEIRSLLQSVSDKHNARTFMITSATAGAGKTSLALALGLSYAGAGNKTLLIDFDTIGSGLSSRIRRIVRSRLGKMLIEQGLLDESQLLLAVEMSERDGRKLGETLVDLGHISDGQLAQALNRQANQNIGLKEAVVTGDLEACITETGIPNLFALPIGQTSVGDVGMFSKKDIHALLEQARDRYDMVLIDTGPILGSLEAALLAKETDATIMVLAAGEQERLVNQAVDRLQRNGAALAGLVFNRARQKDVVRFSSSASQQSRVSSNASILMQPRAENELPTDFGPIASATAAFQPSPTTDDDTESLT